MIWILALGVLSIILMLDIYTLTRLLLGKDFCKKIFVYNFLYFIVIYCFLYRLFFYWLFFNTSDV